jgi:3-oxoacyl-[acyl-carrier-protein] synthase II
MNREVVVTGIGAVTPLGVGARALHERWCAGRTGISDGEGVATEFEPSDHLSVKEIRRADRFTQFAIVAGDEARREAGWEDDLPYAPERVGVVIGTGIGGIGTLEYGKEQLIEFGPKKVPPLSVPLMMSNAAPAALAMRYKLLGPSHGVVSACSAGADGIGTAVRLIQAGDADAMVTGGSEAALTALSRAAFAALDALSDTGVSRPFDLRRDGFVMGEGAGMLILEELDHAKARGAKIYAEIVGYGLSGDAYHITSPPEDGDGAFRCMKAALKRAGIAPTEIDYINAHGTSTPVGDEIELRAVERIMDGKVERLSMSSTKSSTGHLLGAAGAVEAIFSILAIRDNVCPPTLNLDNPSIATKIDLVPNHPRKKEVNIVLSNSFGFGGTNASIVMRRFAG